MRRAWSVAVFAASRESSTSAASCFANAADAAASARNSFAAASVSATFSWFAASVSAAAAPRSATRPPGASISLQLAARSSLEKVIASRSSRPLSESHSVAPPCAQLMSESAPSV